MKVPKFQSSIGCCESDYSKGFLLGKRQKKKKKRFAQDYHENTLAEGSVGFSFLILKFSKMFYFSADENMNVKICLTTLGDYLLLLETLTCLHLAGYNSLITKCIPTGGGGKE
jgi:hypothetical protein